MTLLTSHFAVRKNDILNQTYGAQNPEAADPINIEIISDSILNNINPRGISRTDDVKVLNHPNATSEDLKDFINLTIGRKPDAIIVRIGTNDVTQEIGTNVNQNTIMNRITKKTSDSKVFISSVLMRHHDIILRR